MSKTNKPILLLFVSAMSILLYSCSVSNQKRIAEEAVSTFHSRLNGEDYVAIYRDVDSDFREITTDADATSLLIRVHRKLGTLESSKQVGWFVNVTPSGTLLTLTYESQFSEGNAKEQFIFRVRNRMPRLSKYTVESPLLLK